MAQRFKAEDLKAMVRSLVRQEIKQVVAETINEVLSERYLKKLAESYARPVGVGPGMPVQGNRSEYEPSLRLQMDADEEVEVPSVLDNDDADTYAPHPMVHEESADPASVFFEGTKPIPRFGDDPTAEDNGSAEFPEQSEFLEPESPPRLVRRVTELRQPAAPQLRRAPPQMAVQPVPRHPEALPEAVVPETDRWKKVAELAAARSQDSKPMRPMSLEAEERRLAALRASLDKPAT
jgi:hypothetical protein